MPVISAVLHCGVAGNSLPLFAVDSDLDAIVDSATRMKKGKEGADFQGWKGDA